MTVQNIQLIFIIILLVLCEVVLGTINTTLKNGFADLSSKLDNLEPMVCPVVQEKGPIPVPALDSELYAHTVEALEVKN